MPDNLLENLNPEQLKAVQHQDGPLLIVAGAGTGKTTVITQRIAYLIEQGKARSDEILALTFTEKAAGEMEERVDRLLPMGYLDLWISTFHSFGERIIKTHGLDIGLPAGAKLLNEFEQWALIKNNLDKFDLDYYKPMGNPTKFINALLKHFSRLKDEDISPAAYLSYAEELQQNLDSMLSGSKKKSGGNIDDKEIAEQEINRINEVANAFHVYNQLLLDNEAMDFGDLINYTLKLFRERPAILDKYRKQFKYILLDEFQDTNWAQYELIKLLAQPRNNLVVVGDDDQSVYKFRGASVSNILQFKKDFVSAKEIILIKNYRNKQNILDLAYDFIQLNNPNRLEYALKASSPLKKGGDRGGSLLSKKLVAQNKGKGVIEVIKGSDWQDEIKKVIEKIADIKIGFQKSQPSQKSQQSQSLSWSDFGILTRANEPAKEICSFLEVSGLPYQYLASRGLYAKGVIMDVVAYLKLLDNYHESAAVYRVLNLPVFNFTYRELVNFNYFARKKCWSLFEVLRSFPNVGPELKRKIDLVLGLINKHTALAREKNVGEIILAFVNDSGYLKYLMRDKGQKAQESINLLNQFLSRIKKFEAASDDKSVKAFLSEFNMELEAGDQGAMPVDTDSGPDAIRVMTVHAAKGLEFKYVFLLSMVDKRFPTIERKEPILIPDALVKEELPTGNIHLEEERRLFYVAITRAKEELYFSWAPDYGGLRKKKPSRFLIESKLISADDTPKKSRQGSGSKLMPKEQPEAEAGESGIRVPSYFSHTQLTAYKNCPYQYYFAHILKVPTRGKYVFSFGQAMHLTMQKLFELIKERRSYQQDNLFGAQKGKEAKIKLEEVLEIYKNSWIDDWYDDKSSKEDYQKKGKEIIKKYYEKYNDNWPDAISLEQGVNLKIQGYRIFGKIDRIDDCGQDNIQIVDYKTGAPKKQDKISADDKEQLLIYQMAAGQAMDKKIHNMQFYYLNDNSEVNFVGTGKELADMEEKIIERIHGIEESARTGEFIPKPGILCKYCDFKDICEYRKV
ncbi:UvrD-helicase domain-containing protein [Candidatus Parcubacteria bacterium]|nr:UvrD-helicase domain-containing protein [Candidatus Parcubacteria bacterium]